MCLLVGRSIGFLLSSGIPDSLGQLRSEFWRMFCHQTYVTCKGIFLWYAWGALQNISSVFTMAQNQVCPTYISIAACFHLSRGLGSCYRRSKVGFALFFCCLSMRFIFLCTALQLEIGQIKWNSICQFNVFSCLPFLSPVKLS